MTNAINWFSIPISDYSRAKRFYETILDISLMDADIEGAKMAFFPVEDGGVGGSLNVARGEFAPLDNDNVSVYLNAPDLQTSLSKVSEAGGKLLVDRTKISSEFGYFGIIQDSEGNKIGLHSPN